jgi:hypothetical protein
MRIHLITASGYRDVEDTGTLVQMQLIMGKGNLLNIQLTEGKSHKPGRRCKANLSVIPKRPEMGHKNLSIEALSLEGNNAQAS